MSAIREIQERIRRDAVTLAELNAALAEAVEEGYYIATNGKWGPMEPAENPYKEES